MFQNGRTKYYIKGVINKGQCLTTGPHKKAAGVFPFEKRGVFNPCGNQLIFIRVKPFKKI
jgi:hypothetical protein